MDNGAGVACGSLDALAFDWAISMFIEIDKSGIMSMYKTKHFCFVLQGFD
jgi:hypothetical protein